MAKPPRNKKPKSAPAKPALLRPLQQDIDYLEDILRQVLLEQGGRRWSAWSINFGEFAASCATATIRGLNGSSFR
ncbi:MAG: hypothetical protein MPW15_16625 [Candidatus Manganitrophus sp.]|nr:hypothetical protein [Candidatus Manganitrophus sp.]MDC4225821.1 hypothetical protein [Candidatus Manganitrophus sp.]